MVILESLELLTLMRVHTAWFSKSSDHRCFHTAWLSGVAVSRCCVHIAWWIGNKRLHTAWLASFTIGRIADNSVWSANYSQTHMRSVKEITQDHADIMVWLQVLHEHTIINKDDFLCCPVSCSLIGCRSSPMYFSVRTHFTQQDCESRQVQIFSMPNISQALATHQQFSQIASLIIHTVRLSLAWTSTDLPLISGICRRFHKTCRRVNNLAKIMQCELGITCENAFWLDVAMAGWADKQPYDWVRLAAH